MTDEFTDLEKEIEARRLLALEQLAEADRQKAELAEYKRLKAKFEPSGSSKNPNQAEIKLPALLTMADLAESYFSDERSPIHALRFRTRQNYTNNIKAIIRRIGPIILAQMNDELLRSIYGEWSADGKVSMAHAKVTMLRLLFSYGTDVLKNPECQRLSFALHRMKFTRSKTQNQQRGLTQQEITAIIEKAHEMGISSFALAQALQYECRKLRQKDIIGEWVPISEQPPSDIIDGEKKWVRGIRWKNINANFILRHTLCWEAKEVEIDLRKAPMVMAELDKIRQQQGALPTQGAVIVNEKTGLPWDDDTFRRRWRTIADSVGISKDAKYADSRTGRRRRSA
jgi:hypothetical protein